MLLNIPLSAISGGGRRFYYPCPNVDDFTALSPGQVSTPAACSHVGIRRRDSTVASGCHHRPALSPMPGTALSIGQASALHSTCSGHPDMHAATSRPCGAQHRPWVPSRRPSRLAVLQSVGQALQRAGKPDARHPRPGHRDAMARTRSLPQTSALMGDLAQKNSYSFEQDPQAFPLVRGLAAWAAAEAWGRQALEQPRWSCSCRCMHGTPAAPLLRPGMLAR